MTGIGIIGVGGRMGRLIASLSREYGFEVRVGIESENFSYSYGNEIGLEKFPIVKSLSELKKLNPNISILIDFSSPAATLKYIDWSEENGIGMVIGTTGFYESGIQRIYSASQKIPIFFSPNMSYGINVIFKILPQLIDYLKDFDVEIVEIHHGMKKDSPSGTALKLADIVREKKGGDFVFGREGETGPRKNEIGVFGIRGGDVVGDHIIYFLGKGERIELIHRAQSREAFARGALKAAQIIEKKLKNGEKGLFKSLL